MNFDGIYSSKKEKKMNSDRNYSSKKEKRWIRTEITTLVKRKNDEFGQKLLLYSKTLNNEYIERIHQMSYSSLSDNGMLQIFSFFN